MKLALTIIQTGVGGTSWVTGEAGTLAVGEVKGSRETPVTLPSCNPRLAFTLSGLWVAGHWVGSKRGTLAGWANREGVETRAAGVTPRALYPRAAQAPSMGITDFGENTFQVTVTPFYIPSYWIFWT